MILLHNNFNFENTRGKRDVGEKSQGTPLRRVTVYIQCTLTDTVIKNEKLGRVALAHSLLLLWTHMLTPQQTCLSQHCPKFLIPAFVLTYMHAVPSWVLVK